MATWAELYQNVKFTLVTGDGQRYTPIMKNATLSQEFNTSVFNFKNIKGTLIDKRNPMGYVYSIELYIQGDDHVEVAKQFRKSANNRNPWTIQHPLYERIVVQPVTPILYDNSDNLLNVTRITCNVQETIQQTNVKFVGSKIDKIQGQYVLLEQGYTDVYLTEVEVPKVKDITRMQQLARGYKTIVAGYIKVQSDYEKYLNTYNQSYAAITNGLDNLGGAIAGLQALLSLPAYLQDTLHNRISFLEYQLDNILYGIANLRLPNAKQLIQNQACCLLNAMCWASSYNIQPSDIEYNTQVLDIIKRIIAAYNKVVTAFEVLETATGGELDSFFIDGYTFFTLTNLVKFSVTRLFEVAGSTKQKQYVALTKDSNWIYIASQIYGLQPDDSTISRLIAENEAGPAEMLQVKKGRKIVYYSQIL